MKNVNILLLGNENTLRAELYNDLTRYFKVRAVGFDKTQIDKLLQQKAPNCILVSLKETTKDQLQILELLKADTKWCNLKLIIIGFSYECNSLSNTMRIVADKVLIYPISKEDIIKQICEVCGVDEAKAQQASSSSELKHILVVDDDARMLRAVKNWLQGFYEVSIVNSGAAAMKFLEKQIPDIILLDYEMPKCNGPQTLEMIRERKKYKDIPVFFLTGVSEKEKVENVIALNLQGYILKGITRNELIKKLNDFFISQI